MTRKEKKIQKLAAIYGSNPPQPKKQRKKGERKPPKAPKEIVSAQPEIEEEDSEKLDTIGYDSNHIAEKASEEKHEIVEKKVSLPPICEDRPLSQSDRKHLPAKQRRFSLPIINSKHSVVSQVLKIDENGSKEKVDVYQKPGGSKAWEPVTSQENTSHGHSQIRRRRSSVYHAKVYTPASRGSRRGTIQPKDLQHLIKAYENEKKLADAKENQDETSKRFQHVANLVATAAMFGKYLVDDLNLRYLKAELCDPDYNEKYERLATPDIETDEENEDAILSQMYSQMKYESRSQSEADATAGSSNDQEDTDSGSDDVDSDASDASKDDAPPKEQESPKEEEESIESGSVSSDALPDDIKELMKSEAMRHENEHLFELGIWKPDAFVEQVVEEEADDEESEGDWSLKTDAEEEDDESVAGVSLSTVREPTPEVIAEPPPLEPVPETIEEEAPLLPKEVELPVGDTPDILAYSSDTESSCVPTIYATHFDEYESDVFSKRLLGSIFFMPSSVKSDGDSDMFYCVPVPCHLRNHPTDYFGGRRKQDHGNNAGSKHTKKKRRKDLDELYVQASIRRYGAHDATIIQYGGATKAFRLRMAKLGKDPKIIDDKINARLERKLRNRLKRRKKPSQLTTENLKKLPNISKTTKVLRWVTILKKDAKMNVVYQDSWTGNGDLSSSMRLKRIGGGEDTNKNKKPERKVSLGVRSVGEGEFLLGEDLQKADEAKDGASRVEEQKTSEESKKRDPKKKRFRKKRKKRRGNESKESDRNASEDSLLIVKNWQVKQMRNDENDSLKEFQNDDGNDTPRSGHSSTSDRKVHNSGSDSGPSVYPSPSPGVDSMPNRVPTPESEPEPEEKERKKSTATSRWTLLQPKIRKAHRRSLINSQFVEMTRQLFTQLSLRTKEYSKLPPIKRRNRAFSMANSRFSNFSQKTSTSPTSDASKNTKISVSDSR